MKLSSQDIPVEEYHGVPSGWRKEDIIALHKQLHGKYSIYTPQPENVVAPCHIPDRFNWLEYRNTLHKIGDGVSVGDKACIEIAINYIVVNYFGSYSGFIRERLARLLKSQVLTKQQAKRLMKHFKTLRESGQCFQEFRMYSKLNKQLIDMFGDVNT
jgi:hypothetical protein